MRNIFLNFWVRAKIDYLSGNFFGDIEKLYSEKHRKFNVDIENKSTRLKSVEYKDTETKINYYLTFGYDELGIKFDVNSNINKVEDILPNFESILKRALLGYKNFKNYFLKKICHQDLKISILSGSENMLINMYNVFNQLTTKQRNLIIQKTKKILNEKTAHIEIINIKKERNSQSENKEIKVLTFGEVLKDQKFDFNSIKLIFDGVYLFVDHHLFASRFILEDPSLSVNTVAEWAFFTSLKLWDLNFDIQEFSTMMQDLRKRIEIMNSKRIPFGVDLLEEDLIRLKKRHSLIEEDLREFSLLSEKIFEGLRLNCESRNILTILLEIRSLPNSLERAWGILEIRELGRFSSLKRNILELTPDVQIIKSQFRKAEFVLIGLSLILVTFVTIIVLLVGADLGNFADFVQILTFVIAIMILILRFMPVNIRKEKK